MASDRVVFLVVPYQNGRWWQVRREGAVAAEFTSKDEAVQRAVTDAKLGHSAQVVIHTADGKVQEERIYQDNGNGYG